jgi:hypothetical protein
MADGELPGSLDRGRCLEIGARGLWGRRAFLAVVLVFIALGLANVFGQRSTTQEALAGQAQLRLRAPTRLRGGLLWQARFDITARTALKQPKLVLDRGWFDGMTLNTSVPQAQSESIRDGRVVLSYDQLAAGERLTVWLEFQVNPTNVGRQSQDVELDDLSRPVARLRRTVTVFP